MLKETVAVSDRRNDKNNIDIFFVRINNNIIFSACKHELFIIKDEKINKNNQKDCKVFDTVVNKPDLFSAFITSRPKNYKVKHSIPYYKA